MAHQNFFGVFFKGRNIYHHLGDPFWTKKSLDFPVR